MYVISGDCFIEVMDKTVSLKKGEFILLDGDIPHRLIVDAACRMLNIEFHFAERDSMFPSVRQLAAEDEALHRLLRRGEPFLILKDHTAVYHTLKSLVIELDRCEKTNMETAMVRLLLAQLLLLVAEMAPQPAGTGASGVSVHVKRAIDYLHHHYDVPVKIKDVADAAGVHPGYLHRIFKAQTGSTILQYLTTLRIEKAKKLLVHSGISVADIPDYIGISSREYFSALFKKHTGLSPAAYRDASVAKLQG